MSINDLSLETVEKLCGALEKGPSVNWKRLMSSRSFSSTYTEEVAAMIKCSKDLLDDMIIREIKLQDLVNGLAEIGNKRAITIIVKGSHFFLYVPYIFTRMRTYYRLLIP